MKDVGGSLDEWFLYKMECFNIQDHGSHHESNVWLALGYRRTLAKVLVTCELNLNLYLKLTFSIPKKSTIFT